MGYSKTTWTDRNVQYPNRYTKTDIDTDTVEFTAEPGTVTEAGTKVTAARMNNIETAVESSHKGTHIYGAPSGGTDAYAISFSTAFTAYNAGMAINFKADVSNTGASTINIDSLGAKTIKKIAASGLVDLATGDIIAGGIYPLFYDGTYFILGNPLIIGASVITAAGDMIYGSDAYTPARLPKGTDGTMLKMVSGIPAWASRAGAKGTSTLSGQSITNTYVWEIDMSYPAELVHFAIKSNNGANNPFGSVVAIVNSAGFQPMFYYTSVPSVDFGVGSTGNISFSSNASNDVLLTNAAISGNKLQLTFTYAGTENIYCQLAYSAI